VADSDAWRTILAGAIRDARIGAGRSLVELAGEIGVSKGFLSEAERGIKPPSPRIVRAYDRIFSVDGYLVGLLEDYQVTLTQEAGGPRGRSLAVPGPVPGDAVEFLSESPDGIELRDGVPHVKTWTVRNAGSVTWEGRRLRRTGRLRGRELPASEPWVPIERTEPGEIATYAVTLHCAREAGTRLVRFKMVDAEGRLCFPDDEYGVSVEATSRPGRPRSPLAEPVDRSSR
jgi:transcriptional regulator with XRE-family HTH domain